MNGTRMFTIPSRVMTLIVLTTIDLGKSPDPTLPAITWVNKLMFAD